MGQKKKLGKGRRDKAYWAAKEIGFRSRASFKLIQLNRKWEFLQKSSVCIDLCAAPGSWMQVCRQNMPISSLVIGVDLAPIKPIPNCIALQEDITTERCKAQLKHHLKTAKADIVLHDGAPNVGANWIQDAYDQNVLTLSAFKLATFFLIKGGYFVTKVFRSKDYQALLWVFGQFFKKVHATKPAASRNESAEIFIVCQYYQAPEKIDPKFLDPTFVFSDVAMIEDSVSKKLADPKVESQKRQRQGYEDDVSVLYKEATATQFIIGDDAIKILNTCNSITIDKPWVQNHRKTTPEIEECLKDLKVLNIKDLRMIKKWRDVLKADLDKATEEEMKEAEEGVVKRKTKEEIEAEELDDIEKKVEELKDEERRAEKRKRKKEKLNHEKQMEKINLKMVIHGDQGPHAEDINLFELKTLRTNKDLNTVLDDRKADVLAVEDDELVVEKKEKFAKYDPRDERDPDDIWFEEHDDVIQETSDEYESADEPEKENLDLEQEDDEDEEPAIETYEDEDPNAEHPIFTSLSTETTQERTARKANMWFKKIGDIDEDSDLEDAEMEKVVSKVEKRGGKLRSKEKTKAETLESGYTSGSEDEDENKSALDLPRSKSKTKEDSESSDSEDSSDLDSADEEDAATKRKFDAGGFEVVAQEQRRRKALTATQLALGEDMIYSKKRKRDILDEGWNRYMFNDINLPDWFYTDQEKFYKRTIPVDPKVVEKYKARDQELNVKTIKKVVEAKARRKKRVADKLNKAKKRATSLMDDEDTGTREKVKEINKMYKAAYAEGKRKKETKYVVSKKCTVGKKPTRPAGHKGPIRQVDPREKADSRGRRAKAGPSKGKKRGRKGKTAAARQK